MLEHYDRFVDHDTKFDRVFDKLLKHDIRLNRIEETMATKQDLTQMSDSINTTLDKILGIVTRTEQELAILKHIVEEHDIAIRQMKPLPRLA